MTKTYTIYRILNTVTGRSYIGYTSKSVNRRWTDHKCSVNRNFKQIIYASMRKHGIDKFEIEVIYQSWDKDHALRVMEPYFVETYGSLWPNGYNMSPGGQPGNTTKGRYHSPEFVTKLRTERRGMGNPNWGGKGSKPEQNIGREKPEQSSIMASMPRSETRIASRAVSVYGNTFDTVKSAIRTSGYTHYYICARLKDGTDENIFYV